jgi:NAD-dependent SIR2 family protein deacetylase
MKDKWDIQRRKRYTETGIKRLRCIRCGAKATAQWQICSDGNNYRPICDECDLLLNHLVLVFMRHPQPERLISEYKSNEN